MNPDGGFCFYLFHEVPVPWRIHGLIHPETCPAQPVERPSRRDPSCFWLKEGLLLVLRLMMRSLLLGVALASSASFNQLGSSILRPPALLIQVVEGQGCGVEVLS